MSYSVDELLEQYRAVTAKMTQEKYNYLKQNEWLSPVKAVRLAILKKKGASAELLARVEYSYLFESYANRFYKWWEEHEWGNKENESLGDFADGALTQAVLEAKEKGISR